MYVLMHTYLEIFCIIVLYSIMAPKRAIDVDKGKTPIVEIVESSIEGSDYDTFDHQEIELEFDDNLMLDKNCSETRKRGFSSKGSKKCFVLRSQGPRALPYTLHTETILEPSLLWNLMTHPSHCVRYTMVWMLFHLC